MRVRQGRPHCGIYYAKRWDCLVPADQNAAYAYTHSDRAARGTISRTAGSYAGAYLLATRSNVERRMLVAFSASLRIRGAHRVTTSRRSAKLSSRLTPDNRPENASKSSRPLVSLRRCCLSPCRALSLPQPLFRTRASRARRPNGRTFFAQRGSLLLRRCDCELLCADRWRFFQHGSGAAASLLASGESSMEYPECSITNGAAPPYERGGGCRFNCTLL